MKQVLRQAFGYRQNPLAHWQTGEDVVGQMRSRLGHAPRVAQRADTAAFAGEGDQKVIPAVVTPDARKAVGKDAAFEVFTERLLHIRGRSVVIALAVELSRAGQLKPGLEVLRNRAIQQGALGVAGVVGFGGLGMLVPTRVLV